jgi:hypothetical protein
MGTAAPFGCTRFAVRQIAIPLHARHGAVSEPSPNKEVRPVNKKTKSTSQFVPKLYQWAPRLPTKDEFVRYIHKFENDRGQKISLNRAEEIFNILHQQSHDADREGRRDGIWITRDPVTGEWGGSKTPFNRVKYGMENNTKRGEQSKGSHRLKFGKITARSKQDFLDEIMETEGCGIDRAKQILKTCHANGIARYHKPTNTWRGFLADPPTLAETAKVPPTSKQEEYRRKYGCMPWLTHDWQNPDQSEVLRWIVARELELGEIIDIAEAGKRYRRAWSCSKDKSKLPFVRDRKTKRIRGVDYSDTAVFRQMPRMHTESDDLQEWLIKNINKDAGEAFMQLYRALDDHGDVVELSGNDRDGYELAGVDWVSKEAADEEARRAKEEAERQADLKARMDALRAQLDADDHVDRDPSRKATDADTGPQPAPTVSGRAGTYRGRSETRPGGSTPLRERRKSNTKTAVSAGVCGLRREPRAMASGCVSESGAVQRRGYPDGLRDGGRSRGLTRWYPLSAWTFSGHESVFE